MKPFSNEDEMRRWLINQLEPLLLPNWLVFHGKNISDIVIFKQDSRSPLVLFVEAKYHKAKHGRIPIGGEGGAGYQPEYPQHVGADGKPTPEYFRWASKGWASAFAKRYPMSKEANGTEAFHWWNGRRLDKVKARKRIYVPLYVEQVVKLHNFKVLKSLWEEEIKPDPESTLYLQDFDAYEYGTMSFSQVLNNPAKSMGHGFVLAMLLTNDAALQECELRLNNE